MRYRTDERGEEIQADLGRQTQKHARVNGDEARCGQEVEHDQLAAFTYEITCPTCRTLKGLPPKRRVG